MASGQLLPREKVSLIHCAIQPGSSRLFSDQQTGDRPQFNATRPLTKPRRPRLALPGVPLYLIQCGNNRQACFFIEDDFRVNLDGLTEYAGKSGCRVHTYTLMTNHVHLLVSADSTAAPGASSAAALCGKGAIALARSIRTPTCQPVSTSSS